MITLIKKNERNFITCSCGVLNFLLPGCGSLCNKCKTNLYFAYPFIQNSTRRNAALNYYKHGYTPYDSVDKNKSTEHIYR